MLAHELSHVKRKPATVVAEASGGRTHRRHREMPPAGFEDRDNHRIACASILYLQLLTNTLPKITPQLLHSMLLCFLGEGQHGATISKDIFTKHRAHLRSLLEHGDYRRAAETCAAVREAVLQG